MTCVWLTPWEWACCGDPFEVGEVVEFGIRSRTAAALVDTLGAELVGTVDGMESHHEQEYADRVRGRVVAVREVTREVVERRFEYFVDPFARARPSGGSKLPEGVSAGARSPREEVSIEPIPDTMRVSSVPGVGRTDVENGGPDLPEKVEGPPAEGHRRERLGWLVDVDERGNAAGQESETG